MVLPNAGTRYSAFLNDVRVSVDTVSTVVVAPGRCLNCAVFNMLTELCVAELQLLFAFVFRSCKVLVVVAVLLPVRVCRCLSRFLRAC